VQAEIIDISGTISDNNYDLSICLCLWSLTSLHWSYQITHTNSTLFQHVFCDSKAAI